ncbi:LysR substrate-binding domain-containing protein [Pseudomonas caspiana]|uniref:Transcriptional regulator n=1 Tax=Pseudomonas caspiana TaxID=1451454 RepID=A0A1Y3NYC2_9PSED|nr:LysR substrate-binding domain-containing protein [Pseudomonas caspiana]OUM72590.1 transcriptional regulator [Pseudomonas caspiana]
MNKLELLRSFVRVTELSSFTQASEALSLPRSTVSEHVQALEELLGTRLLLRTTRKVQATPDGAVLYERSKDMLAQMDELESLFRSDAMLSGRLRVDMPTAMAHNIVLPRLSDFLAEHPGIDLEISSTDRRVDLIREGFDCVLRVGDLPDTTLVARHLGDLSMVNCVGAGYASEHGVPQTLADLQQHRMIHYVMSFGANTAFFEYQEQGKSRTVAMPRSITVNNVQAYEAACLGNLGIIQSPRMGMRKHLLSGHLVEILPDHRPLPMKISLLYAHRRHLPERCRVFMDWLQKLIAEYNAP